MGYKKTITFGLVLFSFVLAFMAEGFNDTPSANSSPLLGLPPIPWPQDNPYSKEKAELGYYLYFDKRLSSDGSVACATCHSVSKTFADTLPVSRGIHGRMGDRHAPTIINVAYNRYLFWDGRASSLEEQAIGPIANVNEMTLKTDKEKAYQNCVDRINAVAGYQDLFKKAFGHSDCTIEEIAQAIATFERTVLSGNSPFDRYQAGDKQALSAEQVKGYAIFKQAGCIHCHQGSNFTNNRFANIGIGMNALEPDLGRYEVTQQPKDWGAFKVPTLREVSRAAPYMHDGSFETLEEVIEYYNQGGVPNSNLHPLIRPLHLSEDDKKNLIAFLHSLEGEGWQDIHPPQSFPQ